MNNDSNISNNNIEALDIINIMSFLAQIENMSKDAVFDKKIMKIIQYIIQELDSIQKTQIEILNILKKNEVE